MSHDTNQLPIAAREGEPADSPDQFNGNTTLHGKDRLRTAAEIRALTLLNELAAAWPDSLHILSTEMGVAVVDADDPRLASASTAEQREAVVSGGIIYGLPVYGSEL